MVEGAGAVGLAAEIVVDHAQIEHAREMIDQGKSRNEVARLLSVDPSTLYRHLNKRAA